MTSRAKTPLIHSIVPNVQDYVQNVKLFYEEKIQMIMHRIGQFIKVATELTQIPQHLALEFTDVKMFQKPAQEQKDLEKLMVRDEIEKFLNLKNEVIEYQTGNKYMYPELPKIQRNLNKRKYSKSDSISSGSEGYDNADSKQSINQICNLLGTLNLESKTSDQICDSLENIVVSMNGLSLADHPDSSSSPHEPYSVCKNRQASFLRFDSRSIEVEEMRKIRKVQLRRFELYLFSHCQQVGQENFKHLCQEKLSQIRQLFRTHLEKSVTQVVNGIQQILSKALKDIKNQEKTYVPIHKISSYFNKLNIKFYRSEGVIKVLQKYLTKKVKECVMDSYQSYNRNGVEIHVKTNFRSRFFKHIILENIFFLWLKQAVVDFNKMVNDEVELEEKRRDSWEKIQCEKQSQTQVEQSEEEMGEWFSIPGGKHSPYDHFIM